MKIFLFWKFNCLRTFFRSFSFFFVNRFEIIPSTVAMNFHDCEVNSQGSKMTSLVGDHWKLIQRLALLAYVHRGEDSKDLYKAVIAAKVLKGFYDDCVDNDPAKKAREEAILAISQYVKEHPRASERELQREVEKQIAIFVEKIK